MRHESRQLRPWRQLTSGSPAAVSSVSGTAKAERELATLIGCESAVLCRSTLHAFVDVFETLANGALRIYSDAGRYPIGGWAVQRRQALGDLARSFPEHETCDLLRLLRQDRGQRGVPVIVADALAIRTGAVAPLPAYASLARRFGGWLVVDDTQALGLLGQCGGGSLRWRGMMGRNQVVYIASLAKAFGVPVAVLAGSAHVVERFRRIAPSRYHSSAPSAADVAAVWNALRINRLEGDRRRSRLFRRIRFFRLGLRRAAIEPDGGMFPLQTLPAMLAGAARDVQAGLTKRGIRALLLAAAESEQTATVGFLITARHTFAELSSTLDAVREAVSTTSMRGALACRMN
jgi:8-amino-7-oxononanoate synthase